MFNLLNKINVLQKTPARQRGAVLMVMLVILVVGAAAMLVSSLSSIGLRTERDNITAASLAQAKEALIGRAVADGNHPGSLRCPDTHTPGSSMEGTADSSCTVNVLGRLPWKTLGLNDLRDGSGERLWYTLSPNFADNTSNKINSNSNGILQVYDNSGTNLLTPAGSEAIAIIFAPGNTVNNQQRNSDTDKTTASNYLDIGPNSRNNATAAGPFIAADKTGSFNDRLMIIKASDLMPIVEKRVAGVVKQALTDYYAAKGYYPWTDNLAFGADDYAANANENRGWLPKDASTSFPYSTQNWVTGSPPQWFFDNKWYAVIYYSVAKYYTRNPGGCTTCNNITLSVDGANGVRALFFMPGTPVDPQQRISTSDVGTLSNYLEDSENKDNNDDLYVTPTSKAQDRDRLYWLSSSLIWKP